MQTHQHSGNGGAAQQRQLSRFVMLSSERGYYLPAHCPLPSLPISQVQEKYGALLLLSVLKSGCRTDERLATEPNRQWSRPDCGCGPGVP